MSLPSTLGAIHEITGRQWDLSKDEAWPDLTIVVPFNCRVIDLTGKIICPPVSSLNQGGYTVTHHLTKIELVDLIHDETVPNVKAVWAVGPGGDTARLHLLSQDPYSWLTPHMETIHHISESPP